jgi:hypothetical protein
LCLRDKQAVYKQGSVHVKPKARHVYHKTYITFGVHCKYLEQARYEKRAIGTFGVYVNINLLIKKISISSMIYSNEFITIKSDKNILKVYGKPFEILIKYYC